MDTAQRRAILVSTANPDTQLDYIVQLSGSTQGGRTQVSLRYVPDKVILDARSFGAYLDGAGEETCDTPEDLAVTILNDVNDELVARWVQVSMVAPDISHHAIESHSVVLEDRQPKWNDSGLLDRLKRL